MIKKISCYIKYLGLLTVLIILSSCRSAYLKSDYVYNNSSIHVAAKESKVANVCSSFLDTLFSVNIQAQIYCAKQNKKPIFQTKKIFTDCSLTHPVMYTFNCS